MSTELDTWFETWWGTWNKRWFTSQCKGSKAEAKQSIARLDPDKDLREKLTWYQQELQLRYAKMAKQNINTPWLKHVCRMVKFNYWDDELPDTRPEQQESVVAVCECGKPAKINHWCDDCWDARQEPNWREAMIDYHMENGHDKTIGALTKKYGKGRIVNGTFTRTNLGTAQ